MVDTTQSLQLGKMQQSTESKTQYLDSPFSALQKIRHQFVPQTPACIADVAGMKVTLDRQNLPIDEGLKPLFPTLLGGAQSMQYLEVKADPENGHTLATETPLRIGCVLSGGQAAGGHNVIMGLFDMLRKINPDSKLFGFLAGPHGIFTNNYMEIHPEYMNKFRNMGGFDMIRSGRHKIETPEQFAASLKNVTDLDLDGLIVIGGDDSNTNACLLAEYFAKHNAKCKVIGAPKTIDGDLRNEHIQVSFGFDTATKVYSEAIGNLCSDAVSARDYYHFVRVMGRSASHIALECALQTRINCVLIGEEVEEKKMTLQQITDQVADIIVKRGSMGKNYGVILVPEGLIEFIPEMNVLISEINEILSVEAQGDIRAFVIEKLTQVSKTLFEILPDAIAEQLLLDRDPHGNVQVAKIDTEKLLILMLKAELKRRDQNLAAKFKPQSHYFGYEGRCAIPSNFDSQYCYCIGLNAAVLIREGASGFMSCIKNLEDKDARNWIAAGCPLPTMMGVERRKGKDVPVITKALVELDSPMFLAYVAVRDRWAYLDCYVSPGPIQFAGPSSDAINFMVSPPDIPTLIKETDRVEEIETKIRKEKGRELFRDPSLLSELSQARIKEDAKIPTVLEKDSYCMSAIKKYYAHTPLARSKIREQLSSLSGQDETDYFVEIQDQILQNKTCCEKSKDAGLRRINGENIERAEACREKSARIGVVFVGRQAPGGQNVIDGLLSYQNQRQHVKLIGCINGVDGLLNNNTVEIKEESYAPYRNLGGYDYIGNGQDFIRTPEEREKVRQTCKAQNLTALVLVGGTTTMTDAAYLTNFFLEVKEKVQVITIPASIDGNIYHTYLQTTIGFDTCTKVYAQLIGNMLTDSASAVKYWYFVRLMGHEPSHLAVECALKTSPNMVIVAEESNSRHEQLSDIVNNICDTVVARSKQDANYGCILIPEGLMMNLPGVKTLIEEINTLFEGIADQQEFRALKEKLSNEEELKLLLSPWSYSLFNSFPAFAKQQLLLEREMAGSIKLSQVETEKLLAYFCQIELAKRKKAGEYGGAFAAVTHFFGYQGRSALPTNFDCSLGSTSGFGAGVLIENGRTGMAVSVSEVTRDPSEWRVGGVPLLALLQSSQPKAGFSRQELVIPAEMVNLQGRVFQTLKSHMHKWKLQDHYTNPGPNQFYLEALTDDHKKSETLRLRFTRSNNLMEEIRGLCNSIQNDCMYTEHQHLLFAALASLKAAKNVINSQSHTMGEDEVEQN